MDDSTQFSTVCPRCGTKDRLFVTSYVAGCRARLTPDGFDTTEGFWGTTDEQVQCDACGAHFTLDAVTCGA